ncbi:hypothetical protein JKP88DRAFT_334382 [Tribonema minus]|uniref:Uncharacterized protein n=1 Tax=Tribonema minus TaxID=303371 RepID=A0A836C978_9STRA|nr:hypothetical protein JKP88DRAFT_334382 [Tribonema minus]
MAELAAIAGAGSVLLAGAQLIKETVAADGVATRLASSKNSVIIYDVRQTQLFGLKFDTRGDRKYAKTFFSGRERFGALLQDRTARAKEIMRVANTLLPEGKRVHLDHVPDTVIIVKRGASDQAVVATIMVAATEGYFILQNPMLLSAGGPGATADSDVEWGMLRFKSGADLQTASVSTLRAWYGLYCPMVCHLKTGLSSLHGVTAEAIGRWYACELSGPAIPQYGLTVEKLRSALQDMAGTVDSIYETPVDNRTTGRFDASAQRPAPLSPSPVQICVSAYDGCGVFYATDRPLDDPNFRDFYYQARSAAALRYAVRHALRSGNCLVWGAASVGGTEVL